MNTQDHGRIIAALNRLKVAITTLTGSDISGSGTLNTIPLFTAAQTIGNSVITQTDATNIKIATITGGTGAGNITSNTAFGYQALNANTTGSLSVAIGYQALATNSTGLVNVAVGYAALGLATGSSNVAVGYNAGRDTTSGGNSVFIGESAGRGNLIGVENTYLGKAAGLVHTGDQSVFLGAHSGRYATTGSEFFLNVYNNATYANDQRKSLMYGVFSGTVTSQTLTTNSNFAVCTTGGAPQSGQRVFAVNQDTAYVSIGSAVGATSYGAIYFDQATPSLTNYGFLGNATYTALGNSTTVDLTIGNVPQLTLTSLTWTHKEALNYVFGTATGTKLGTATSQKIGLWNAAPVIQQTTASAASTFVANTSLIANDTATFDGYTLGQVVKILRTIGILA